jgi:hypothetical protein
MRVALARLRSTAVFARVRAASANRRDALKRCPSLHHTLTRLGSDSADSGHSFALGFLVSARTDILMPG